MAGAIADEILDGALPMGSWLREEQVSARFGVGRHTARSAIQLLATRRLVVHERNRGARVPELTIDRVDEVFAYRSVIEIGSLRLALGRGADLTPVFQAVTALADLPADSSWRELTRAHGDIHHAIVAAAGNERLMHAYTDCELELRMLLSAIRPEFSKKRLVALHRALADGLRVGGEPAVRALADDIELAGRAALLHALRERAPRPAQPGRDGTS